MPTLVILSTHFGTNFSGGSTATCKIFERLQDRFEKIQVVGTQLGNHTFANLVFNQYGSQNEATRILNSFDPSETIFYGDFFNSVIYTKCNLPFYFTYHDNWPELGELSVKFRLQCLFYWRAYRQIFTKAQHVFVVSQLKLNQVRQHTPRVSLVRNGVMQTPDHSRSNIATSAKPRHGIVMVGNIDQRKYSKALLLFEQLKNEPGLSIDIYGHVNDAKLCNKLKQFPFVNIKGFTEYVPYEQYRVLLHTSLMENLSIVWCESVLHETPVLTFNVGAAEEVIYGNRGQCIAPYDIDTLRGELLKRALADDDTVALGPPENLRAFESEFNWDAAAQNYGQLMFKT